MGGRSRNSRKKYRKTKPQRILIRCGFLVGAGGLKEPGSRLPAAASCLGRHAHPAGRSPNSSSLFLPLAAVVAVAQGLFTRRTIRRVLRVALAAFSAAPWQGFEKAERCPSLASLFPPQAAVGSAAVRIHPCSPFCKADKTETPVPIGYRSSWWARVDCASRASKKAPQGLFYPPDYSAGRCCSNPPLQPLLQDR